MTTKMDIIRHLVFSTFKRVGFQSKGLITRWHAKELFSAVDSRKKIITHRTYINGTAFYFYSDDHNFGHKERMNIGFSPCTAYLPNSVLPRPSLPSGVINTFEEYSTVFLDDKTLIEDFEQLVDFIYDNKLLQSNKP